MTKVILFSPEQEKRDCDKSKIVSEIKAKIILDTRLFDFSPCAKKNKTCIGIR